MVVTVRADAQARLAPEGAKPATATFSDLASSMRRSRRRPAALRQNSGAATLGNALSCMDHPQPRPNAVPYLWEATSRRSRLRDDPAFYGCYDWHSAVNSHGRLSESSDVPRPANRAGIRQKLNDHFGATNIAGPDVHARRRHVRASLWVRVLLRLQYELRSWNELRRRALGGQHPAMGVYVRTDGHVLEDAAAACSHRRHPIRRWRWTTRSAMRARSTRARLGIRESADPSQTRHPVQHAASRVRATLLALLDGSAIMGQLMDRDAFLPCSTRFCPRSTPPNFTRSEGAGAEYVKNPTAIASNRTSLAWHSCARRRW